MFVSDEFENSSHSRTERGRACRDDVESRYFWDEVRHINEVVDPIIKILRLTDGLEPCIGKVYEGLDKMIESLARIEKDSNKYETLHKLCQDRWNAYHSPLHAAAFVLDPEFQGCHQESDREVSDGWDEILYRLVPESSAARRVIKDQLLLYRTRQGKFGTLDAQNDRKSIGGALWWEDYGSQTPELQQLAIRILSQAVSSSCLEQLWSTFNHISSRKRNRLGTMKVNDLVFVSANLRLLNKVSDPKADPFVRWREEDEDDLEDDISLDDIEMDVVASTSALSQDLDNADI